ncbi:MAG: hypothetical protein ACM3SS_21020 [Rhodospirillaceae bacterium]
MTFVEVVRSEDCVPLCCCHGCGARPEFLSKLTLAMAGTIVCLCFSCVDHLLRRAMYGADDT